MFIIDFANDNCSYITKHCVGVECNMQSWVVEAWKCIALSDISHRGVTVSRNHTIQIDIYLLSKGYLVPYRQCTYVIKYWFNTFQVWEMRVILTNLGQFAKCTRLTSCQSCQRHSAPLKLQLYAVYGALYVSLLLLLLYIGHLIFSIVVVCVGVQRLWFSSRHVLRRRTSENSSTAFTSVRRVQ